MGENLLSSIAWLLFDSKKNHMQHDVLHPPLRAIWGSALTFSAISIPVTLRSLSICYSRFVFTKKVWTNYHNTTFGPKHLVHYTTQSSIPPEKSTFMSAIEVSSAEVSPSCTWYKIIAKMLSLDIFAPLQQILNMIWRWLCECCSWLILHRCALYQIFYMIQRWLGECYLGYFCNAAGCNKYCVASANWKSPIHSPSKPKSKFYS